MRQFRLDYSLKNVPIPSRDSYLRNLIEKAESVLKRMRWKAHFFLKREKSQENTRNFGLSSNKTPSTVLGLKPFEDDVIKLLETIKFRDKKDYFQNTLANDLRKINSSDKMFVFADKTRNIYETSLDTYNKLLHDNITKTYKHGSEENISEINNELNHIANRLSIGNRIERILFRSTKVTLIVCTLRNFRQFPTRPLKKGRSFINAVAHALTAKKL